MKNVQEKIGYTFKNVNLLETALTHSSYANECKKENNERLEFVLLQRPPVHFLPR